MTTLEIDVADLKVAKVKIGATDLLVSLEDGRLISTPLWWYPKLQQASQAQRANHEIMPMGLHWPDLDEDISVAGLVAGHASGESQASLDRWLKTRK